MATWACKKCTLENDGDACAACNYRPRKAHAPITKKRRWSPKATSNTHTSKKRQASSSPREIKGEQILRHIQEFERNSSVKRPQYFLGEERVLEFKLADLHKQKIVQKTFRGKKVYKVAKVDETLGQVTLHHYVRVRQRRRKKTKTVSVNHLLQNAYVTVITNGVEEPLFQEIKVAFIRYDESRESRVPPPLPRTKILVDGGPSTATVEEFDPSTRKHRIRWHTRNCLQKEWVNFQKRKWEPYPMCMRGKQFYVVPLDTFFMKPRSATRKACKADGVPSTLVTFAKRDEKHNLYRFMYDTVPTVYNVRKIDADTFARQVRNELNGTCRVGKNKLT